MSDDISDYDDIETDVNVDALAVLELLEDAGTPMGARVAAYLDPHLWTAAHSDTHTGAPTSETVTDWLTWVAQVMRIGRGYAVVGRRAPSDAATVTELTGISEGDLLADIAELSGQPEIAEWIRTHLAALTATGPDGRPLFEDPTGVHAVVVRLAERTPRRTS